MRVVLYPTPRGALTQLWAGTSPETASLNGKASTSSSPANNETYVVRCSISSHGRGLVNLAATTQGLGESCGLGSRNRLRMSDHPPPMSSMPSRLWLFVSVLTAKVTKGIVAP